MADLRGCPACGYPLYEGEACPVCADNAELLAAPLEGTEQAPEET